jgi:hypothetical protein
LDLLNRRMAAYALRKEAKAAWWSKWGVFAVEL